MILIAGDELGNKVYLEQYREIYDVCVREAELGHSWRVPTPSGCFEILIPPIDHVVHYMPRPESVTKVGSLILGEDENIHQSEYDDYYAINRLGFRFHHESPSNVFQMSLSLNFYFLSERKGAWPYFFEKSEIFTQQIDKWLKFLRYYSRLSLIGTDDAAPKTHRDDGIALFIENSREQIAKYGGDFKWSSPYPLKLENFFDASTLLESGENLKIWNEFIIHSHSSYLRADFRTAIIETAIACESVMRSRVQNAYGAKIHSKILKQLSKINLTDLIDLLKSTIEYNWSSDEVKEVLRIISARNRIMHQGSAEFDSDKLLDQLRSCWKFVRDLEKLEISAGSDGN